MVTGKIYAGLLGGMMVVLSGCSTRPALDRASFGNDGTSVRSDSQSGTPVRTTPQSERLGSPALIAAAIHAADAQMATGEYATAADLYTRAYDAKPELTTLLSMSRALRMGGQAQRAVLTMQSESRKFGQSQGYLVELGRAALAGGFMAEAETALTSAVSRRDAGWAAYSTKGVLDTRRERFSEAKASFERARSTAATAQERDAAEANLAMLVAEQGNSREAVSLLEPLAARPTAHRRTVATLAVLYGMSGQRAKYAEMARRSGMSAQDVEAGNRWLDISNPSSPSAVSDTGTPIRQSRSANHRP